MKTKNKMTVICFLCLMLMHFNLVGCNFISNLNLNMHSDTVNNEDTLSHFMPKSTSAIQVEFDFPENWLKEEEYIVKGTNITQLSFLDPRYITIPEHLNINSQESITNYGYLTIQAYPLMNMLDYDNRITEFLNMRTGIKNLIINNTYTSHIDKQESFVIETTINPSEDNKYETPMFDKNIFFVSDSQIYQINMVIPKDERDEDFEKGFEIMISSIKILDK